VAAGDGSVALAVVGLTGTICAGFFTMINKQNKTHDKIAKAVDNLAEQSRKVVVSNQDIARATRQGSREAKERNGHLADMVIQQGEMIKEVADNATTNIILGVSEVNEQHIKKQHVDESVVDKSTIKGGEDGK
jgi:hypothetical protein